MKTQTNLLRSGYIQSLIPFFSPRNVAILYAKNDELTKLLLWNLITNPFGGIIYPISDEFDSFFGIKTYPSLDTINDEIELVIIKESYSKIFDCLKECFSKKVKSILVLSTGFREDSSVYQKLKQDIYEYLHKNQIRMIGPGSYGIVSPYTNLNASIIKTQLKPGNIAFLSQSGSLGAAILDWIQLKNIGLSAFVSLGSSIDVPLGELIDYFGHDVHTKSIIIYMETLVNVKSFISASRETTLTKPIIVLRAGKEPSTHKIIQQRMGYPCDDNILNAIFSRSGILRVESIEDLFHMAEVLSEQIIPEGNRIGIITNAVASALLTMEEHIKFGGEITDFSEKTKNFLKRKLKIKKTDNPLELTSDADENQYEKVIDIIFQDENVDGILVILTPQALTNLEKIARKISQFSKKYNKPILTSFMGGQLIQKSKELLVKEGIPVFEFPNQAIKIFNYMWKYSYSIKGLYETPLLIEESDYDYLQIIKNFTYIEEAFLSNKEKKDEVIVNESDLEILISHFHLPIQINKDSKIHFLDVLENKYIFLKLKYYKDKLFGPVFVFEQINNSFKKNLSYAIPPLNTTLFKRMILDLKFDKIFNDFENDKNIKNLEIILLKLSNIIIEFPKIKEFEFLFMIKKNEDIQINYIPLLEKKMILHHPETNPRKIQLPIIKPYPKHYTEFGTLKNGERIIIRPIRPEDEPLIVKFHYDLSERSIYLRYLRSINLNTRIAHERLIKICFIDYDREIAIVITDYINKNILGIGRLTHNPYSRESEFGILISDKYQNMGLGTMILKKLIDIGKRENRKVIFGVILKENKSMIRVCEKLNFKISYEEDLAIATYEIENA